MKKIKLSLLVLSAFASSAWANEPPITPSADVAPMQTPVNPGSYSGYAGQPQGYAAQPQGYAAQNSAVDNSGYAPVSPDGRYQVPNASTGQMQGQSQYNVTKTTTNVEKIPDSYYQERQNAVNQQAQSMSALERFWDMSDAEIRNMKKKVEQKQAAIKSDVSPNRCVSQREIVVKGASGESIPHINIDKRNYTNIMFIDSAGTPFPIHYALGNKEQVQTILDEYDIKNNLLLLRSTSDYSQGNITVKLVDNPVPIVFTFAANQRNTDCVLTVRVNKLSKQSKIEQKTYMEKSLDASLNRTLRGEAPKGSRPMRTSNPEISAWLTQDNEVVIRSPYKIVSPMPKGRIADPDGVYVYRVQKWSSYLYEQGKTVKSFTISF